MKAVIFSAGNGTRLRPITDKIAKPMVKVGGKPVIEHIVEKLHHHNIREIVVNLHYKPMSIVKHFGDELLYMYEKELLGEVNTLKKLQFWLMGEPFIAVNGDTLSDVTLPKMYNEHRLSDSLITAHMDQGMPAGTWMFSGHYFSHLNAKTMAGLPATPYYEECDWFDIGTPKRLEKARRHYG